MRERGSSEPEIPSIRHRRELSGCGCLDCRNVGTSTVHRSVVDSVLWSLDLVRAYPSIVVVALAFVVARRVLELLDPLLFDPAVWLVNGAITFVLVSLVRAYVATTAVTEVTGVSVSLDRRLRRTFHRTPALIGVSILLVVLVVSVMILSFVVAVLVTGATMLLVTGLGVDGPAVIAFAAVSLVSLFLVALPILFLFFKCWLAMEACVVGWYGPIASYRVSWRITGRYRNKLLVVVLAGLASVGAFALVGALPEPIGGDGPVGRLVNAVSTSIGELLSVVWYGVYAHLYVQAVIQE